MIDFKRLTIIFFLVLLSGCQKVYETQYNFNQPTSEVGQQCITKCQRIKAVCEKNCQGGIDACLKRAKAKSLADFDRYAKDRQEKGLPITKDSNSFYNPLQCSDEFCQCDGDYRACYELCGGDVEAKQVCVKNCDQYPY